MAVARDPYVAIDCPDPALLGNFYAELLGWNLSVDEGGGWADLVSPENPKLLFAFQQVEGFRAPEWPGQDHPQQMHVDVSVDDLDEAEAAVIALGATKHAHQPSERGSFRVYLDPAGHPFCLCKGQS